MEKKKLFRLSIQRKNEREKKLSPFEKFVILLLSWFNKIYVLLSFFQKRKNVFLLLYKSYR